MKMIFQAIFRYTVGYIFYHPFFNITVPVYTSNTAASLFVIEKSSPLNSVC